MQAKWLWLIAGIVIGGAVVYIIRGRATVVHLERNEQGQLIDIIEKVTW